MVEQCYRCENELPDGNALAWDDKPTCNSCLEEIRREEKQKTVDEMPEQLKCPKCGELKVSREPVKRWGHLIGGVLLFPLGLLLCWGVISIWTSPRISGRTGAMGGFGIIALVFGGRYLASFINSVLVKQIKYVCGGCHNNWEQRADEEYASVAPHLESLRSESPAARAEAIKALADMADESAVESLESALKDHQSTVRISAVFALGRLGGPKALEYLKQTLSDQDRNVRLNVAESLGKIGGAGSIEPLLRLMKDDSSNVRTKAREVLLKIKDKQAVEPLIQALKHADLTIRASAAETLGNIGDPAAVEALTHATQDKHRWVRNNAKQAIKNIEGR